MQKKSNTFLLPRNMAHDKEQYQEVGFSFKKILGNEYLYNTTLPEGWSSVNVMTNTYLSGKSDTFTLLDQEGRTRGFYVLDYGYPSSSLMRLVTYYGVHVKVVDENTEEVFFGTDDINLFSAGFINSNDFDEALNYIGSGEFSKYFSGKNKYECTRLLKSLAKGFGNEYYPEWGNIGNYWDSDPNLKTSKKHN